MNRYLTKSRFKLASECPTKLFYTGKKEYPDSKVEDQFLQALAEGGYQVGELAKLSFPEGIEISTLNSEDALKETARLLQEKNVVIFEAAIAFENLLVRIDILVKEGNNIQLIEVKAKSYDSSEEKPFFNKTSYTIKNNWRPYLEDVAFQKHVLTSAYPHFFVTPYLMMAHKNALCPTDGLNQKFRIVRDKTNRKGIKISSTILPADLKPSILIKILVEEEVDLIHLEPTFLNNVSKFSDAYSNDTKLFSPIGAHCKNCEFTCDSDQEKTGSKNGFKECWKQQLGWSDKEFAEANILEVWNFRRKEEFLHNGKVLLKDIEETDLEIKLENTPGLSTSQRQWLQIEKAKSGSDTFYFDKSGMIDEMAGWKFPLHFIDFETSAVALPFTKGRHPYESVAFQFSHHIVTAEGEVLHAGEYLDNTPGQFPNYNFVRSLKKELEKDDGTIFRYATHENSILNQIYKQLAEDESEIKDKKELCDFILSITSSTKKSSEQWTGERTMVDLCALVKKYYYDPHTHGSNSIKAVLPAILHSSNYLQKKYSKPIYGSSNGIKSLNFRDWTWLELKEGKVIDPYKKLPKLFDDCDPDYLAILDREEEELKNGGAALVAYGKMQFSEMTEKEREILSKGLLRYCELDTLAMVMIYEAWREWVKE